MHVRNQHRLRCSFLSALICLLGTTLWAQAPQGSRLLFYERFIAIDQACAWPNLSLLPDGKIAAIIWPYMNHGVTEGSAECWVSADGGKTWNKSGIPVPHTQGTNRMNVAAGPVGNQLVALVGGWNERVPFEPGRSLGPASHRGLTIQPVTAVSDDSGTTWNSFSGPQFPLRPSGKGLVPYGRIAKLKEGGLGAFLYGEGVYFYHSNDGGRNWTLRGTLTKENTHNETTWVELENGDLFAAARTYGDMRLDGYRSVDGGRTWKLEGPITLARQHPGDLLKLPDGRVLLSYATRNPGLYGIWIQIADPQMKTWSTPMMLVDLEGSTELQLNPVPPGDGGYPSTVQLADGTFVTAYYSRGIPSHQRYHVGVVRWQLPKNALPSHSGPAR